MAFTYTLAELRNDPLTLLAEQKKLPHHIRLSDRIETTPNLVRGLQGAYKKRLLAKKENTPFEMPSVAVCLENTIIIPTDCIVKFMATEPAYNFKRLPFLNSNEKDLVEVYRPANVTYFQLSELADPKTRKIAGFTDVEMYLTAMGLVTDANYRSDNWWVTAFSAK